MTDNNKYSIWVITCMCGITWAIGDMEKKTCECGATLFHNVTNHTCHAEVDDTYDLSNKKYTQPYIYQEKFDIEISE